MPVEPRRLACAQKQAVHNISNRDSGGYQLTGKTVEGQVLSASVDSSILLARSPLRSGY